MLAAEQSGRQRQVEECLYEVQSTLTHGGVKQCLMSAGLPEFTAAAEQAFMRRIREDVALADRVGVVGTPQYYLDGVMIPRLKPDVLNELITLRVRLLSESVD